MQKVEAIIKPERLDIVKNALAEAGLVGINVAQRTGHGTDQAIVTSGPRGVGSNVVDMVPKIRLERASLLGPVAAGSLLKGFLEFKEKQDRTEARNIFSGPALSRSERRYG